ncbi:MAG: hypothetical protein R3E31_26310 [Chloroflexota bacterium]
MQGVHVPLAILATLGLLRVILPWLARSRPWQKLVQHPRYSSEGLAKLLIAGFLFVTFRLICISSPVFRCRRHCSRPTCFFARLTR